MWPCLLGYACERLLDEVGGLVMSLHRPPVEGGRALVLIGLNAQRRQHRPGECFVH